MAKFRVELGAETDLLDEHQLRHHLDQMFRSWRTEILRGQKFVRFRAQATVAADGSLLMVPSFDNILGPKESVVWSVKGIAVTGLTGSQFVDMTINGHDFVRSFALPTAGDIASEKFGSNELVLYDSDTLNFTATGLTAAAVIVVTGRAAEVPIELVGRL